MCDTGYWFCPNCEEELNPCHVTFQEHHESCGHPAVWIEPEEASVIEQLQAENERLRGELDFIHKTFTTLDDIHEATKIIKEKYGIKEPK